MSKGPSRPEGRVQPCSVCRIVLLLSIVLVNSGAAHGCRVQSGFLECEARRMTTCAPRLGCEKCGRCVQRLPDEGDVRFECCSGHGQCDDSDALNVHCICEPG